MPRCDIDLPYLPVKIQAAVCDGNTIGHPCCAIHDCKEPLLSHRARFCEKHHEKYYKKCAVLECQINKEDGFRTCNLSSHRSLETAYFSRGKAIYELRRRLQRSSGKVPPNSIISSGTEMSSSVPEAEEDEDEVIVEGVDDSSQCDEKSPHGNRKIKAYFGRRRTHNEQIIMRPCGIIISRATFYGSEAIASVNVS